MLLLLLLLLLTASQRGTYFSPLASSAYRHPMAAVRDIDDLFDIPAAGVFVLVTLDEVQGPNRDDESDEDLPRAKRTFCSRRIRRGKCLL